MTRKLKIMVTASTATALVGVAGIVGASPAMAAGVYECLKPVSTTVNYPNGTPLVYELDENLKPIRHYYLGDQAAIAAAMAAVANQGKAK